MANYKSLIIWQKAFEMTFSIYRNTKKMKSDMDFRFREQIRSSSVSVVSNIAEGYARHSDKEKARFLDFAKSSCAEFETQLLIALELEFIEKSVAEHLLVMKAQTSVGIERLRTKILKGR